MKRISVASGGLSQHCPVGVGERCGSVFKKGQVLGETCEGGDKSCCSEGRVVAGEGLATRHSGELNREIQ